MTGKKVRLLTALLVLMGAFVTPAQAEDDILDLSTALFGQPGRIVMLTPYSFESDMEGIAQAYSEDASAPWGFRHLGMDFSPKEDHAAFRAVADGVVEGIYTLANSVTGNWQVNVHLRHNARYLLIYAFEPMSPDQAARDMQLTEIVVSVGQEVSAGDLIGHLYKPVSSSGVHVHFDFQINGAPSCPEPYFTSQAAASVLKLLHLIRPGALMCYFAD